MYAIKLYILLIAVYNARIIINYVTLKLSKIMMKYFSMEM